MRRRRKKTTKKTERKGTKRCERTDPKTQPSDGANPRRRKKKIDDETNVQHVHERKRVLRDASDANETREKHAMGKTTTRRNPSTKEHDRNQRGG